MSRSNQRQYYQRENTLQNNHQQIPNQPRVHPRETAQTRQKIIKQTFRLSDRQKIIVISFVAALIVTLLFGSSYLLLNIRQLENIVKIQESKLKQIEYGFEMRIRKIEQIDFKPEPNPIIPQPPVQVLLLENTFLHKEERQNLEKNILIQFDINQNYKIVFNRQRPHNFIQELNNVLINNKQFILISLSESNKRYVFGVYVNKQSKKSSFIFNLNTRIISKIKKQYQLLQIDHSGKAGPIFGKMDIIFFNPSNNYKSVSDFCNSFECPLGIRYGTQASQTYLAGANQFNVNNLMVIVKK